MALVAYDASGSSSESEDESPPPQKLLNATKSTPVPLFSTLPIPKEQTPFSGDLTEAPVIINQADSKSNPVAKKRAIINIPSLAEFSDEDSPSSDKKAKKTKRGLFAVLPPPKNTVRKEGNRALIPHTLTKRQNNPVTKNVTSKAKSQKPGTVAKTPSSSNVSSTNPESEDENDEDPVDFFSFDGNPTVPSEPKSEIPILNIAQNAPLPVASLPSNICINPDAGFTDVIHPVVKDTQQEDVNVKEENEICPDGELGEPSSWVPMNDEDILQDEGFLRLQGKRNKGKGIPDNITIIDVSQDDQLPSAAERQSKALTQETEYRPKSKGFAPTSQQRRKHQITYLAFQAREREYELKNQWAENRMTKKQTQSKYGF